LRIFRKKGETAYKILVSKPFCFPGNALIRRRSEFWVKLKSDVFVKNFRPSAILQSRAVYRTLSAVNFQADFAACQNACD
jgi:hypothetical protein